MLAFTSTFAPPFNTSSYRYRDTCHRPLTRHITHERANVESHKRTAVIAALTHGSDRTNDDRTTTVTERVANEEVVEVIDNVAQASPDTVSVTETGERDAFNWYEQWYPLAFAADLDKSKPTPLKLLDMDFVVWWSRPTTARQGEWVIFRDRCPHRLAALSEGRINERSGNLECGYHGWQFNTTGNCTAIPQTDLNQALGPSRAMCATSLPLRVERLLLFVWLGDAPPAAGSSPAIVTDDARATHVVSTFTRTLPLCLTTLFQNVLDPAHIHFAHHGQIGRREYAAAIPIQMLTQANVSGFAAQYYEGRIRVRFRPPALVEITTAEGKTFAYYAVPVEKGVVRTLALSTTSQRPRWRWPMWMDHARRNTIVEGDLGILQSQEREMRRDAADASAWSAFCMPTESDKLVVELGRWLSLHAPRASSWYGFAAGADDVVGDTSATRHVGHTMGCTSCRAALRNIERARSAALAGFAMCVVAALLCWRLDAQQWILSFEEIGALLLVVTAGCSQARKTFF